MDQSSVTLVNGKWPIILFLKTCQIGLLEKCVGNIYFNAKKILLLSSFHTSHNISHQLQDLFLKTLHGQEHRQNFYKFLQNFFKDLFRKEYINNKYIHYICTYRYFMYIDVYMHLSYRCIDVWRYISICIYIDAYFRKNHMYTSMYTCMYMYTSISLSI